MSEKRRTGSRRARHHDPHSHRQRDGTQSTRLRSAARSGDSRTRATILEFGDLDHARGRRLPRARSRSLPRRGGRPRLDEEAGLLAQTRGVRSFPDRQWPGDTIDLSRGCEDPLAEPQCGALRRLVVSARREPGVDVIALTRPIVIGSLQARVRRSCIDDRPGRSSRAPRRQLDHDAPRHECRPCREGFDPDAANGASLLGDLHAQRPSARG